MKDGLIMLNKPLKEITINHPTLGDVILYPEVPLQYQSGAWAMSAEETCSNCDLSIHCNNKCEFYDYSLMKELKGE